MVLTTVLFPLSVVLLTHHGSQKTVALPFPRLPFWAQHTRPVYRNNTSRFGPSAADTVDLSSGVLEREDEPDIVGRNTMAADASFDRVYTTALAAAGMHEVGMTTGWRNNYSFTARAAKPGTWGPILFEEPKGNVEQYLAVLNGNGPTGQFLRSPGAPYVVSGVPSKTEGQWDSLTWLFGGESKFIFLPEKGVDPNVYRLSRLIGSNTHGVTLNYDQAHGYRLSTITDDRGTAIITLNYNSDGLLESVCNWTGQQVFYGYQVQAGQNCLATVSPITDGKKGKADVNWRYDYTEIGGQPFLCGAETPSPQPGVMSIHKNVFDPASGREIEFDDADGRKVTFTYHNPLTKGGDHS